MASFIIATPFRHADGPMRVGNDPAYLIYAGKQKAARRELVSAVRPFQEDRTVRV